MKKELLEYSMNKGEILNKKSSIVHISNRGFKYHEPEKPFPECEPPGSENFLDHLNGILLLSRSQEEPTLEKKPEPPFFRCVLTLIVVFFLCSGGFFGPFFLLVDGNKVVRVFWRQVMHWVLLCPVALCERRLEVKHELTAQKVAKAFAVAVLHAMWSIAFGLAVSCAQMMHVYILNAMDVAMLFLWKAAESRRVARLETVGAGGLLVGAVLVLADRGEDGSIGGDFMALAAGLLFALYSYNVERQELNSPFWLCSFVIAGFSSILTLVVAGVADGTWDTDEKTGVFGVFTQKWFFVHIVIALSAGVFYFNFLNLIRKHYSETLVRLLVNLLSIFAGFINYFLGFAGLPSVLSLVAAGIVVVAGVCLSQGKKSSEGLEFELNRDGSEEGGTSKTDVYYMEMKIQDR